MMGAASGSEQAGGSVRRPAAVLVPIYDGPRGPTMLLIRRTAVGQHAGQIAFPGGRPEPGDADLLHTALREAREELGIAPRLVRIIGRLPAVETASSNYVIQPFVGRLAHRPALRLQASEVAGVLDVPLAALDLPELPREALWDLLPLGRTRPAGSHPPEPGVRRRLVRYFPWNGDQIWGATARMIEALLDARRSGALALLPAASATSQAAPAPSIDTSRVAG